MSGRLVALISLNPRVYLLKNHNQVGPSANRLAGFSLLSVLIGRTDFDPITSIPDPTLSINSYCSSGSGMWWRWWRRRRCVRRPRRRGQLARHRRAAAGRGLHSSTFQLNLSRFGHTSPCLPVSQTRGKSCTQRITQHMLTSSRKVDECTTLVAGAAAAGVRVGQAAAAHSGRQGLTLVPISAQLGLFHRTHDPTKHMNAGGRSSS